MSIVDTAFSCSRRVLCHKLLSVRPQLAAGSDMAIERLPRHAQFARCSVARGIQMTHFDRRAELADEEWFRRYPGETQRTRPASAVEKLPHPVPTVVVRKSADRLTFEFEVEASE